MEGIQISRPNAAVERLQKELREVEYNEERLTKELQQVKDRKVQIIDELKKYTDEKYEADMLALVYQQRQKERKKK
ncbi:MAG: hypothetical protein IJT32_02060 [Lachnospiraceae bacterium]|nr:hypothetical protein [Lachnospiraceae bacterium]